MRIVRLLKNIFCVLTGKKKVKFKPKIDFLVFWVGTKCTLKCEKCCNLIPYLTQVSYNADEIIEDLKFLRQNADIKSLQIQGGEPFCHNEISKIINAISKMGINDICIATNGTINLKNDEIDTLKNNPNVKIRISDYDCCQKIQKIFCARLDENNIKYQFYDFMYKNNTWFSSGGIYETMQNDKKTQDTYNNCDNKYCHTLADGILTACGKVYAIKEIYDYKIFKKNDEVNIRKLRKSKNPLKKYFLRKDIVFFKKNRQHYKEQCRYCNIADEYFPAAEQLSSLGLQEALINISKRKNNE